MNKKIILSTILISTLAYSENYCKKDYMSNFEYATKKIVLDKKKMKGYAVFSGKKYVNRQINKSTYILLNYKLFDEKKQTNWVNLTRTYLKNEKEHLGLDLDISERTLFFSTLKKIGLLATYNKKDIKEFYIQLFKTYDFFSDDFQRPSLYNYMIMKNLNVATKKDLDLYFKSIKSKGNIYDDQSSENNYFARRYYYAFFTDEKLPEVFKKMSNGIEKKETILAKIANVCRSRKIIDKERKKPININELINLFYYSFIYPDIQPTIEQYFNAIGLMDIWSYWNYKYYDLRNNSILKSHYFQLFYLKSDKDLQKKIYYDYISVRTEELKELMAKGDNYTAFENAIKLIGELASIKEGIEDKYFEKVNKIKSAINDSSSAILEHFIKVGDMKTYNRIAKQRDDYVLLILKRKY